MLGLSRQQQQTDISDQQLDLNLELEPVNQCMKTQKYLVDDISNVSNPQLNMTSRGFSNTKNKIFEKSDL